MAGGKETPRQKMIGMMYLVLTAMLALNVSKTILDAFVAIEENIQISNENEYARGQEKKSELEGVAADKSEPEKQKKAQELLQSINQVDVITAKRIKFIDDLKLELLKDIGEDLTKKGDEAIIVTPYNSKEPIKPARMNLANVGAKDKYDEAMRLMGIDENLKKPKGKGQELWKQYNSFRKELTELMVSSAPPAAGGKPFFFKAPEINKYKNTTDLKNQVVAAIEKSNVPEDEKEVVKDVYIGLTKQEVVKNNDKENIHWIGKTFDHSPAVAALASLSSLENEILTARATAIALIRSRVGGGEYSFNKIMALAYGPELVNASDEYEVQVLMAAYDSDKQPEVTLGGTKVTEVNDGKGFVRGKAGAGDVNLKGDITIKNKSGIPKTLPWEKTIKVMKPQGTVTLPEMNVLYRGYPNKVTGVASGYDQTVITGGANVSIAKSGELWIATPGAGADAVINIAGKSSVSGKTANLGAFKFRVKPMPKPSIFVGAIGSGGKISTNPGGLNAGYPPEIPLNANFTVLNWECTVSGVMGKVNGQGSSLAGVNKILGQARPGATVAIEASVVGPDKKVNKIYEVFKL